MEPRAISTLAWARTSAEADMLTRKSGEKEYRVSHCCIGTSGSHQSRNPKYHLIHSRSYSIPISFRIEELKKPTLNSSLGTDGGSQTEGAGHEVGEDLVGARRAVGLVLAE